MDSVSSTLSSESSVSFSESDTDGESIHSSVLFQLAHSLPDDIATAAAEGDLTVVRRWLESLEDEDDSLVARGRATTADTLDFSAASAFYGSRKGYVFKTGDQGLGYYLDDVEKAKERVLEGLEVLGRVAGLPNELRSKVLGYWCLAE